MQRNENRNQGAAHIIAGPMVDHVTSPPAGVLSPANTRSAQTNWDTGWSRTKGWIHCGNRSTGCKPTDNQPEDQLRHHQSPCMVASGFLFAAPIRSPRNDSAAPISSTKRQKPKVCATPP